MSPPQRDSEPPEDSRNLTHLKIRIPIPKAHFSMRSLWTSQRGKARCDYCRANNLKCDRILPICNYCDWAKQQECTYAPTPNTSHRGIPRCDRCREHNLKVNQPCPSEKRLIMLQCDRDIPSCSYCKEIGEESSCFYPSKLRPKPMDIAPSSSDADNDLRKWSQVPPDMKVYNGNEHPRRRSYYRESQSGGASSSKSTFLSDVDSDPDSSHRGRFTADYARSTRYSVYKASPGSDVEYVSHPMNPKPKIQIKSAHIEPWSHPAFVTIPSFACRELYEIDPVEMPKRQDFDNALDTFHNSIMSSLRETSLFSVSKYSKLARSLTIGDMSSLSERIRIWASVHRLSSGSGKYNIILVPRDSVFSMPPNLAEEDRQKFMDDLLKGNADLDQLQIHHYDRLPVQTQIYDILTYAHRYHYPAASMLLEVVRLRFAYVTWPMAEMYVKMCPLCSIRTKQTREKWHSIEEPNNNVVVSPTHSPPP